MVNIYPEVVVGIALSTLNTQVALKVMSGYEGDAMQQKTLLKSVRLRGAVSGMTSGEGPVVIGLAYGETSVGSIKIALETVFAPETGASTTQIQQANSRRVLWESITIYQREFQGSFNLDTFDSGRRSLGGGKGLPFMENVGWQVFVYNLSGGNLTTGATISILMEAWGVSLE